MPPALRAIASSCGTSPEGIHIKHLLNIGHNLTQGSRDLSTAALGRAFQVRSDTPALHPTCARSRRFVYLHPLRSLTELCDIMGCLCMV